VKFIEDFEKFLTEEVNLDSGRITRLQDHVDSVTKFLNGSDWGPKILQYSAQGSWAHKTIIKPPGTKGFDADLLVFIDPVEDWTPEDYISQLRRVFRGSGVYREKTSLGNRCVTIGSAGDFDVDVVPYVVNRPGGSPYEVCNRIEDEFEPTDSEAYTAWLDKRNTWVGNDRLRR
jgi:Second Messenger Oligonucleotide or Dinucleotide Synthetase domain